MPKISPLSNVKPFWKPGCKYPDRIRLAMSDGTIRTYWDEPQQPKWKRWNPIRETIGYPFQTDNLDDEYPWYIRQERHQHLYFMGEYIPKHNKKTGCAANTTGK